MFHVYKYAYMYLFFCLLVYVFRGAIKDSITTYSSSDIGVADPSLTPRPNRSMSSPYPQK